MPTATGNPEGKTIEKTVKKAAAKQSTKKTTKAASAAKKAAAAKPQRAKAPSGAKKPAAKRASAVKAAPKALVIVESPAKAATIEKYLGNAFTVRASMGHLRDLPKSQFGIDIEHGFAPKYINIRGKGDLIKSLKKDAAKADRVYLASDPDREGEAIAWHLAHILEIDPKEDCRIVFNEITKPAVLAAVQAPHPIDMDRVDAQQTRRMLDRIVGYQLSPLLWRKVRKGLSAGRVQSVTVRLICDREREIQAFRPEEYWTVSVKAKKGKSPSFMAEVREADGKKLALTNQAETDALVAEFQKSPLTVTDVKTGQRQRKPSPPFTTSSLQQDAARKLGFTSRKTMMLAQQLYEGIDIGRKGRVGLITYMRTDSTRISDLALSEVRTYLSDAFGAAYVPAKPNFYAAGKKAQDAHEGIRPTSVTNEPAAVEKYLTKDQWKLYNLVWQRFVACQMANALFDTVSVALTAGRYGCRASGSTLKFPGFLAVYTDASKKERDVRLPELAAGDVVTVEKLLPEQHFTEPPPRYNEASLVKTLEEDEIGRPSTYAPIIETILARGYVVRKEKQFQPTELGCMVNDMLEEYFKDIVDVKFTAEMENRLDDIADGKTAKETLLKDFYAPFEETLKKADAAIEQVEAPVEVSDVVCEKCGRNMVVKLGRFGKFLACPGFPDCRNTKPILKETGASCPKCGKAIVERRSKRGRTFYGCESYPECDYTTWDQPLKEPCKECGSLMLAHRYRNGRVLPYCSNDGCRTRIGHPINKEIEKQRAKEAKESAADTAAEEKTAKRTSAKKTAAKSAAKTAAKATKRTAPKAKGATS